MSEPAAGERAACRYVMHAPGDPCDCKARLAQVTTHTRTSTNGNGPDYCAECSAAISEWVPWPCTDAATPDAGDASEPLNLRADQVDIWRDAYRKGAEAGVAAERGRSASREAAAATRARAEVLREAARDLPGLDTIRTHGDAANWLRDRADSLARTIPTTATVRDGLAATTAADNEARWNRALKGGA